jgi:hypothetical protein
MADTTPVYGFPFLELGDPPDLAAGTENLATAIESKFISVDAAISAITGLDVAFASSSADETSFQNTTFAPGTTTVGVAFVAPPSGKVVVHWSGSMTQSINGGTTILAPEMKTGGTIGSGTLTGGAANGDRALTCSRAVNSAPGISQLNAANFAHYTGLTSGATYNVRLLHCVDIAVGLATGNILFRQVMVVPAL